MLITGRTLPGLYDVRFNPTVDHRGFLAKPYDELPFHKAGIDVVWRQILMQRTERRNTLKGLHIQTEPFTEAKLITPIEGRVLWVSVDLRKDSATFLRHEKTVLEPNGPALFAARGFAHGCLHLTDDTLLLIAADNSYSEEHGVGIAWNDPEIAIDWPLIEGLPLIIKAEHRDNPPFAIAQKRLKL